MIGGSLISDVESGYFTHPDEQIEEACATIRGDPQLADGYNAIGFSQGAQFLWVRVENLEIIDKISKTAVIVDTDTNDAYNLIKSLKFILISLTTSTVWVVN